MGAGKAVNAQCVEDEVRGDVARDARWGITEAIGGLWTVWSAILGNEPSTARAFASLLECEADDWRSHASHLERHQGEAAPAASKGEVNKVVELRVVVEDPANVERVRSDLFRLMKGLDGLHDVPGLAAGWMLKIRDPSDAEKALAADLSGRTTIGRDE